MSWPDDPLDVRIRIALDADRTVDWTTWDWEDISECGREAGKIVISQGDADEWGETPPATCALVLDNTDGRFFRRNPLGPYYGRFGRNTPIWIEVDPGTGYETRFVGEIAAWPKRWDPTATDATVQIQCAGVSRRLAQNDARATSAATGYLPSTDPVAYWPLEDGEDASAAASGIPGGAPMTVARGAMDFTDDAPPGSAGSAHPLPSAQNALVGRIVGAGTSGFQIGIWTKGEVESGVTSAYYIPWEIRTSTGQIFRLAMQWSENFAILVAHYTSEDQENPTNFIALPGSDDESPGITGEWIYVQFLASQNGADADVSLYVNGELVDSATWTGLTLGEPIRVNAIGAFSGSVGTVSNNVRDIWLSQLSVHGQGSTLVPQYEAGIGFPGEGAADRIIRLCNEAGVPITVIGAALGEPMGAQGPGTLMALARACETADGGTLQDNPTEPGLLYIPRAERYNLLPWELDVADADIGDTPEATDDDQRTANQVTATRPNGGSFVARAQADIDAYGIVVDDPISPDVWQDAQLPHQAGWRLHLDQADEDRWPKISLNFARRPELIPAWVNALPGETRARVSNMPGQVEPVDVIVEGWTETISQVEWRADLFCSPASPWTVGVVEDPVLGRADTDGSALADAITGLASTSGPLNSNPYFETDTSGWLVNSGGTISRSTAQAHQGVASLLFTPDGVTATGEVRCTNSPGVVVGQVYRAAAWVRCAAARTINANIVWRDGAGTFLSSAGSVSVVVAADTWAPIEVVGTAPVNAAQAQISINMGSTPPNTHLLYIDEATLKLALRTLVMVTAGPPWITTANQSSMFPLDIRTSGVVLSVTGIATVAVDTFTRSVGAGGWGSATTGQAWSVNSGVAANWSVTGSVGRIATATINQLELATINVDTVDADPRAEFLLSVVPTGSGISFWVASRFTDTNNYYYATLLITSGAVPELRLFKRVGGTGTQLGSTVTLNGPHVAGDRWVLQCSAIGSTIRARGWKSTQPTEQGWHITATDTALTTGTRAGVGVRRETGNTNGSTNVDIDPFEVPSLQTFTFDATPVNGVVKTITAGSPVSLAHPWRLAL